MKKTIRVILAVLLIAAAALSFTVVYDKFSSSEFAAPKEAYLDQKKTTVLEMSAVSTAASAAITLLPGDVGTPIAEKLADLSHYSLFVLCAVFLEKYLIGLTCIAAFKIAVPIGLGFIAISLLIGDGKPSRAGLRIALCGILVFSVIPLSITVSSRIEQTYQDTLKQTMESAIKDTEAIENNSANQSMLDKFVNSVVGGAQAVIDKFERTLTNMIEGFAVLIVTSCVIPIIVYLLIWWAIKILLGVRIPPMLSERIPEPVLTAMGEGPRFVQVPEGSQIVYVPAGTGVSYAAPDAPKDNSWSKEDGRNASGGIEEAPERKFGKVKRKPAKAKVKEDEPKEQAVVTEIEEPKEEPPEFVTPETAQGWHSYTFGKHEEA